jgi:glutathione S-transferase
VLTSACHLGFASVVEERFVDAGALDPGFIAASPPAEIPALVARGCGALFDSSVIAAYLEARVGWLEDFAAQIPAFNVTRYQKSAQTRLAT